MSVAPRRVDAKAEPRSDRWLPWIAAGVSALWHVLLLLLLLWSPPITVTAPQGGRAGSPMVVDFVGVTPSQPRDAPSVRIARPVDPAQAPPATSPLRFTQVVEAADPVRSDAAAQAESPLPRPSHPAPRPTEPAPRPPNAAEDAAPPAPRRRAHRWGMPPGMPEESTAPVAAGPARSPATGRGKGRAASSGPSLEVGGYQVYYDLLDETRLRAWRDQGMTEFFLPLPGTRDYMICPLEIALRHGSGACRLLPPDDPALAAIGDARDVLNLHRIYRLGELLWRGPGPYR